MAGSAPELLAPPLARTELERTDPRGPVEAAGCGVILLRVPEGAVVNGIERHRACLPGHLLREGAAIFAPSK